MRPSPTPTIADLYLAFRQAKTALFFERRGVGLLELATYEQDLPKNLKALQRKLAKGFWFDKLDLGETWIVPKRLRESQEPVQGVVRIGTPHKSAREHSVDIQVRLNPHPEFAIAEVLYLWQFGGLLDALLAKEQVLGYRLDLRGGQVSPNRRWLFEYWPSRYQKFREAPLEAARLALQGEKQVLIISGDLASFYDTVSPSFMLGEKTVSELQVAGADEVKVAEYRRATESLLRAYQRFWVVASRRTSTPISIGVPIGSLTSRVVANLSLVPLDRHVAARPGVLCYRRYVDDLAIVARARDGDSGLVETLREFLPLRDGDDGVLRLNVESLDRADCEFQLQKEKVRVHLLAGVPGKDFVDAIASDFAQIVSERRAFIDPSMLVGDGVTHLIRAGQAEGSPLRVLRDADRARLERFALSTSLHSLERVSSLISHGEARDLVRRSLERVGRVLDSEDDWVGDLDVSLRLLKLAICTGDWTSATELRVRMDRVWGTVPALRAAGARLYYRNRELDPQKSAPWTCLRNYLHERRFEAISTVLPIGMDAKQIASRFSGGLLVRTKRVGATTLRRRAELLARADLRSRDREDDGNASRQTDASNSVWMRKEVEDDQELAARFRIIDTFVERCRQLGDLPWAVSSAQLFLCTRPPSYFDIARRWLYRVERDGFVDDVFESLLGVVNAVRGTEYRDTIGTVIDRSTVSIESFGSGGKQRATARPQSPRIVLGNLVVPKNAWRAAAKRAAHMPYNAPILTLERLQGVARVIEKSMRVARGRVPSVLVLPELSLPRQWFRAVSSYVVQQGRFGLVTGLEYQHDPRHPYVSNQVFAVVPGPFSSVAVWPWTKRVPAREEGRELAKLRPSMSFPPVPPTALPRTVVKTPWGAVSVLICSELIEARRVADLLGRVNVVLCPAWNTDTSSYDHLIQSVGFQLHTIIAIANNGHYSDCRAWAPRSKCWQRDLCRLIERDVDDIVHVDIPLASLVAFHGGGADKDWKPLPPAWP